MEIKAKFWIESKGEVVVGGGKTSTTVDAPEATLVDRWSTGRTAEARSA